MPHVSKFKLSKKSEEQLKRTLDLIFSKLTKEHETRSFLTSLLSPTEKLMLAKRLAIIILLNEGFSQTEIAGALHVTRETVSRVQLLYEMRGEGYDLALQKLKDEKLMEEVKGLLVEIVRYSIRAAGGYVKPSIT